MHLIVSGQQPTVGTGLKGKNSHVREVWLQSSYSSVKSESCQGESGPLYHVTVIWVSTGYDLMVSNL